MLLWKNNNDLGIYSFRGEIDKVVEALATGANPNFCNEVTRGSVCMTASQQGHVEIVRVLLAAGADANYELANGDSAMQFAADKGHVEILELLITVGGAAIDAQDSDGNTPLISACLRGRVEAVRLLLRLGADPSVVASGRVTAMSVTRNQEILSLLRARIAELAR